MARRFDMFIRYDFLYIHSNRNINKVYESEADEMPILCCLPMPMLFRNRF